MESKLIIDIDIPLQDLMSTLGCNQHLISQAQVAGLACTYQADGVKIYPLGHEVSGVSQIAPIKLGVLQSLINGKLSSGLSSGSAAKDLARIGLEKAVKYVLAAVTSTSELTVGENLKSIFVASPPKTVEVSKEKIEAFAESLAQGVKVTQGVKVKLKDATHLFQPVSGTDETSRYFCIAIRDDLKVAARIKGPSKISIRVEGSGINKYKNNLLAAGLSDSGTYCSVHLSADTVELARKCVGAVLYGIGLEFKEIVTDLQPIWNKGT